MIDDIIFYAFKIDKVTFRQDENLTMSTSFVKTEVIEELKRKLAVSGYKMATDNSHKFTKIGDELYIEGMAYQGQNPDQMMIKGYFNTQPVIAGRYCFYG